MFAFFHLHYAIINNVHVQQPGLIAYFLVDNKVQNYSIN